MVTSDTVAAVVAITAVVLLLGWQWSTIRRARRIEGEPVPDTSAVDTGITSDQRVYFLHAAHCGHCRAAMPLVDRLRAEYPNLNRETYYVE